MLIGGAVGGATVGEGLGCAVGDGVGGGCVGVGGGAVGDGVGEAVCAKLDAPPKDSIVTIASMTIAIDRVIRITWYSLYFHESQHDPIAANRVMAPPSAGTTYRYLATICRERRTFSHSHRACHMAVPLRFLPVE